MSEHVYRYPVVRPMDPRELREARRARLRAVAHPAVPVVAAQPLRTVGRAR